MTNMFNKRLIPKRELKNPHLQDYLTEDNKYLFNMLKKQPNNSRKKYNLRNKTFNKEKQGDIFSAIENDEILKTSNSLYKFTESFKQESKKSKFSINEFKITNSKESPKTTKPNGTDDQFSWVELIQTLKIRYEPKQDPQSNKRKYEAIKSTTISSDGEHSQDDSIIEITSKKVDMKKDIPFVSSQQIQTPQKNVSNDQKQIYLETLKKINADIMQENNKILFPQMNYNSLFNVPNLTYPMQNNSIQNNPLLNNIRLALNNNVYPNMNSLLPQMMNPMYSMNYLSQCWPNYQGLNQMSAQKINKLNFVNTPYNNLASILALLQQNGVNPSNL